MICGMSAKKRSFRDSSLPDQKHTSKKPHSLVNLKSHIHLIWDDSSKRVIPTKEQIGIPWSHLAPSIHSPRKPPSGLADVASVPSDIFAFQNLSGVLSYEVWVTCLTEADRKFLAQFLPTGTNADQIVHLLLTGKNHYFGNPFLSWSSSLCYGNLHPDAVLNKEQQIRADKKAYRAELNNYHSDMIEILTKWKEKWSTCENPESLFRDNPAEQKQGALQSPGENIIFSKAPKNEMPMKVVQNGDISKFMSYIKISRSQHDLVKRMKRLGDGIQTKQLTRVIGDIDNFHVEPYETLVEDEKKRLRNHWAILSCKDLPAAFEAHRERKSMIENSRTSLCLELEQRNVSTVEKAEQVTDRAAEVGQDGAHQNGDISDGQEELVECSPQAGLQAGSNSSEVLGDQDAKDTNDTETCIHSHDNPNMKHQDAMDMNNTNITIQSQSSSDEQDQDLEKISGMNTSTDSGNNSDGQTDDLENISYRNGISQRNINQGVEDEDMEGISCQDTTLQDHNIPDMQAPEPKAINPRVLVEDFKNNSYTGLPIHGHGGLDEKNNNLKYISHLSASTGHDMSGIPLLDSNKEMNRMLADQKEAESIAVLPSDGTLLFSKTSSKQNNVEEGLELKQPVNCEKVLWQSASSVDSFYCPPGNSLYTQSDDLQLKHHLSGGPATSMIDLGGHARRRQRAQVTVAAALPMGNAAPLLQPCTNQLNKQQLQNSEKGIGMVPSCSVGHLNGIKQSIELHSVANDSLAQSGLVQEQMQLLDQRHNGLYLQQLENNLYSGAGLCTQETLPMVEQQSFAGHTRVDRSCGWFPDEHTSHNNWSGMESDGIVSVQDGRSSADGSLLSVLSQYKQASSGVQLGASSSDQCLGTRILAPRHAQDVVVPRAQNMVPQAPNIYGYTQNVASTPSSHVDGSANNLQWAQGGHTMPDPCFRQFGGGPWSR